MDPENRKRLKAWKAEERRRAHAALPLSDGDMKSLFDALDVALTEEGCDHTRRVTEAWLEAHGHAPGRVLRWLDDTGGYCDCEVLANAEQAWRFATGES